MARRTATAQATEAAPPRRRAGALAWATFLLAGYAAVVGTMGLSRGRGGSSGPLRVEGLDERLDRDASLVRTQVRDDLAKSLAGFQDAVEKAVRRIDGERERLKAVAEDGARRAADVGRVGEQRAEVLEAKLDELDKASTLLRGTVDGLVLSVRDLSARVASGGFAPSAPAPSPAAPSAPSAPAPSETPAAPAPAPAGPTAEEAAAIKEKVRAAIADLASPDAVKVFPACAALAKLGDLEAVEPLVRVLREHKDAYARMAAVNALGALHACDAMPAVVAAFMDKDEGVVLAAAVAFSKVTSQDTGLSGNPSRRDKSDAQDKWSKWWKEHEADVRARWGQPAGGGK